MQFVLQFSSEQEQYSQYVLPESRLRARAAVETAAREQAKNKRHRKSKTSAGTRDVGITGEGLLLLCLDEAEQPGAAEAPLVACALVSYLDYGLGSVVSVVLTTDFAQHWFSLADDLLPPGRPVLVFLGNKSLEQGVAQNRLGMGGTAMAISGGKLHHHHHLSSASAAAPSASAAAAPASSTRTPGKRQRDDSASRAASNSTRRSTATVGSTPRHSTRAGTVALGPTFAALPEAVTPQDYLNVNRLLDRGILPVTSPLYAQLEPFLCTQCRHLPALTRTMSCCGIVVCPACADPFLRWGSGSAAAATTSSCPECGEVPEAAPLLHHDRGLMVHQVIRELKVLYREQLEAIKKDSTIL